MELISKEELINKINAYIILPQWRRETTLDVQVVKNLINSMPTVDDKEIYQRGFRAGQEEIFRKSKIEDGTDVADLPSGVYRPTGEWIDRSEDGYVECPFCHEATNCDGNIRELRYCWNCGAELGADMRCEE